MSLDDANLPQLWTYLWADGSTPIGILSQVLHSLDLQDVKTIEAHVSKYGINITVPYADFPAEKLRDLKRHLEFKVPSWATDSTSKPITAELEFPPNHNGFNTFTLSFELGAAFACRATGATKLVPAPDYAMAEANKLAAMTPEEALAYVKAEANKKAAPRVVPLYTCDPA